MRYPQTRFSSQSIYFTREKKISRRYFCLVYEINCLKSQKRRKTRVSNLWIIDERGMLRVLRFQMSSLEAGKGDTVTQLRSFTVLSRPFIQGLQGNELTRSAYSQPAMISHGRRTSTTSLTRVSRSPPLFLSIHQSTSLPEGTILADRGYESSSNQPPPAHR